MGSSRWSQICEIKEKIRDMECKFEADKALMERGLHTTQLEWPTLLSRRLAKP